MTSREPDLDLRASPALREAWAVVDRWLDRQAPVAPWLLEAWGLHLWAASRRGGPGADEMLRQNAVAQLGQQRTLLLARRALEGPMVLLKGLAAAELWPDPVCRPAGDVDVLVPDADAAWEILRADGWTLPLDGDEVWQRPDHPWSAYEDDRHWHAYPLRPPGGGAILELHRRAPWPLVIHEAGMGIPAARLLAHAVPFPSLAVRGVNRLAPTEDALVMAATSWGNYPYEHLRQLVDVWLYMAITDRECVAELAETVGLGRLWRELAGAATAEFAGGATPLTYRLRRGSILQGRPPRLPKAAKLAASFAIARPADVARTSVRRLLEIPSATLRPIGHNSSTLSLDPSTPRLRRGAFARNHRPE